MVESNRLSSLQPAEKATISGYSDQCSCYYRQQLLTMGVVPKTVVELLRIAPLGDPMEFLVRGTRLTLRKSEAHNVLIEVIS